MPCGGPSACSAAGDPGSTDGNRGAAGAAPSQGSSRPQNGRFSLRKCRAWSYLKGKLIPRPTTDEKRMRKLMLSLLLGMTLVSGTASGGGVDLAAPDPMAASVPTAGPLESRLKVLGALRRNDAATLIEVMDPVNGLESFLSEGQNETPATIAEKMAAPLDESDQESLRLWTTLTASDGVAKASAQWYPQWQALVPQMLASAQMGLTGMGAAIAESTSMTPLERSQLLELQWALGGWLSRTDFADRKKFDQLLGIAHAWIVASGKQHPLELPLTGPEQRLQLADLAIKSFKQAVTLYPEVTQEIGPPGVGVAPIPIDEGREGMRGGGRSKKWLWAIGTTAFVGVGFSGFMLFGKDLLNPPVVVDTEKVRIQKVTLYYASQAQEVLPRKLWPQRFDKGGQVVEILVRQGDVVKKGQPLVRMKLPAAAEKQLAIVRQKRQSAERATLGLQTDIEKLQQEAQKKGAEVDALKGEIDKASKKDAATLRKRQAALKKEIAALKKRVATPQKLLAKQQKVFDASKAAELAFVQKEGAAFLRAAEDGVVHKIDVSANEKVDDKQAVVVVADSSAVHVRFRLDDGRMRRLQKDEKVKLVYGANVFADAFVIVSDDKGVAVEAKDPDGELGKADRATVQLVREVVDGALLVPAAAKLSDHEAYVIENDFAVRRAVEWVDVRGKEAIAKKGLAAGERVVVGPASALKELQAERVRVEINVEGPR